MNDKSEVGGTSAGGDSAEGCAAVPHVLKCLTMNQLHKYFFLKEKSSKGHDRNMDFDVFMRWL